MARSMERMHQLVAQVRAGDPVARQRFRAELEPWLAQLVRRAMQAGTGKLAGWGGRASGGIQAAADPMPALVSLLSGGIVQQVAAGPSYAAVETVMG